MVVVFLTSSHSCLRTLQPNSGHVGTMCRNSCRSDRTFQRDNRGSRCGLCHLVSAGTCHLHKENSRFCRSDRTFQGDTKCSRPCRPDGTFHWGTQCKKILCVRNHLDSGLTGTYGKLLLRFDTGQKSMTPAEAVSSHQYLRFLQLRSGHLDTICSRYSCAGVGTFRQGTQYKKMLCEWRHPGIDLVSMSGMILLR